MLLPIAVVVVVLSRIETAVAEECSVPWIWNGHIEEPQSIYNDKRFFYENVPMGSVRTQGSTLYLVCQNDHLVIGLGISRTPINCFKGKWNPDPVCRKKDCSVPWISNGIIEEEITIPNQLFDWRLFRYVDGNAYKQVPVGSMPPVNTTLLLACQQNHLVLGLGVNKTKIICSEGKWTPQPVCLKRPCSVPFIRNGRLERLTKIRSSSERRYHFKEVPVGGRAEDSEHLSFVCNQDYTPEDIITKYPSRVICEDGEWSRGLRCKPYRHIVATVTSEIPVESASTGDKEIFVEQFPKVTQIPPTTPKQTQENCSCTYNSHDRKLSAVVNGVGLWYGDKVKKGDTATLRCRNQENLVLQNGISGSGSLTLSCDICRIWEDRDLPSCKVVHSAYPVESVSVGNKETAVNPSNSRTPNPISSKEVNSGGENGCFCIYDNPSRLLYAKANKRLLRYRDKVKKSDSVILRCNDPEMQIELPNGTKSTSGAFILTCKVCETWKASQLPTCHNVHSTANPVELVTVGDKGTIVRTSSSQTPNPVSSTETISAPGCLITDLIETTPLHVMPEIESVTEELQPVGSEVPLMCENSLILTGDKKAKCGARGAWEYGNALCILGCNGKDDSPSLIMEPAKEYYRFGEDISLKCPSGQELTSDVERMMCIGANIWSNQFPECQAKNKKP